MTKQRLRAGVRQLIDRLYTGSALTREERGGALATTTRAFEASFATGAARRRPNLHRVWSTEPDAPNEVTLALYDERHAVEHAIVALFEGLPSRLPSTTAAPRAAMETLFWDGVVKDQRAIARQWLQEAVEPVLDDTDRWSDLLWLLDLLCVPLDAEAELSIAVKLPPGLGPRRAPLVAALTPLVFTARRQRVGALVKAQGTTSARLPAYARAKRVEDNVVEVWDDDPPLRLTLDGDKVVALDLIS